MAFLMISSSVCAGKERSGKRQKKMASRSLVFIRNPSSVFFGAEDHGTFILKGGSASGQTHSGWIGRERVHSNETIFPYARLQVHLEPHPMRCGNEYSRFSKVNS